MYFIYGFGAALGKVSPWTIDAELYSRNATSAALIAVALAAGVPPAKFKGNDVGSNQAMIAALAGSTEPEAAIGFVSTEVADANRDSVRTLAPTEQDDLEIQVIAPPLRRELVSTARRLRRSPRGTGSELDNSSDNTWTAPDAPGTYTLWVVLRDDRGAASWRGIAVQVKT